jgi:hypothetical protein
MRIDQRTNVVLKHSEAERLQALDEFIRSQRPEHCEVLNRCTPPAPLRRAPRAIGKQTIGKIVAE